MVRRFCTRLWFSRWLSPLALAAVALAAASAVPAPAVEPPPAGAAGEPGAAAVGGLLRVPQDVPTLAQAISRVADGGIIELAAATYAAPASGFKVSNAHKGFTIRAAAGAAVVLDAGGRQPVFVLRNSARAHGGLVVFENLIFRNGGGGSPVTAAGVTVDAAEARFVGCSFQNNAAAPGADGGGVKVRNGSDASFIGCTFSGNSSPIAGGAMMVDLSNVEVLGGSFVDNRVNLPPYDPSSHGGAINVIDGTLYVSDALFEGNQAGWVGGAILAFGTPTGTPATPHALVSIIRSTFQANVIAPQPCCPPPAVPTGGALHVEEQASLFVQDSRFVDNQAQLGGAINAYRALVSVAGSTFQGNGGTITGAYQSVGGAICALTNGTTASGQLPRPAAVTVTGSLLQGGHRSSGSSGPVANAGGCILSQGDEQDLYGQGGVPPSGTLDSARAPVAVSGSVFDHCDVQASPQTGGGMGGAINGALVALTLADSLVLESSAAGNGSGGGGIFLGSESAAHISQTTFAGNAAGTSGGAIFGGGSDVEISGSRFIANQVSPGIAQPVNASRGAALYFIPALGGQPHAGPGDASGVIAGTLFSQNLGLPVWDVDFGGPSPVNTVQYNGNDFFDTTFGDRVYVDTYADPGRNGFSVAGLDSLVISRAGGPTTVKSALPNQALLAAPAAGSLKVIPPSGSPSARSAPFLAYAWSGNFAALNGAALPQHQGLIENAAPGSYSLVVDGATVDTAAIGAPQCTADPVLCVANYRFRVQVQWELPTGERGEGHPVALSGDTGYFWFFDPANVELIVKILDGRPLNGRFWVFYGALSNVRYTLTVTDTVTGAVNAYVNPQGQLASVADTSAFLGTGDAPPAPPVVPPPPPPPGPCARRPGDLCLGSRFRVDVAWRTSTASGSGTAVPLSGDTGTFWFFSPSNVELVVKLLDGRSINGRFWVFYGALSNVGYTITVTDTQTGRAKTYVNPPGTMASVADTSALPGP
jgi:hypothetical protein